MWECLLSSKEYCNVIIQFMAVIQRSCCQVTRGLHLQTNCLWECKLPRAIFFIAMISGIYRAHSHHPHCAKLYTYRGVALCITIWLSVARNSLPIIYRLYLPWCSSWSPKNKWISGLVNLEPETCSLCTTTVVPSQLPSDILFSKYLHSSSCFKLIEILTLLSSVSYKCSCCRKEQCMAGKEGNTERSKWNEKGHHFNRYIQESIGAPCRIWTDSFWLLSEMHQPPRQPA